MNINKKKSSKHCSDLIKEILNICKDWDAISYCNCTLSNISINIVMNKQIITLNT